MPIMFNTVLEQECLSLADIRLLRHRDNRSVRGRTPYDLWYYNRPEFDRYQATQGVDNEAGLKAKYWASFLGTPGNRTMFVGIYQVREYKLLTEDSPKPHMDGVDEAGSCHFYDLVLDNRLSDLIARLFIDWGPAPIVWIQRADNQNKSITELRSEAQWAESAFPGFLDFRAQLSRMAYLPPDWVTALRSCRGVYVLTCPRTKELYVGSATGEDGFWGRWQNYLQTGHGGNVGLLEHGPSDYQVAILEVAGTAATRDEIVSEMEPRWKLKLQSGEMGLTRN